ncbi:MULTISPECIES: nuclease-related domain-containing protein [Bacillaceae]|uniref:NERD domain-containing protein n=1 Tax=Evansella alkalicola TaxID=745819 RepID=A0ABS6JYB9_9BACI|nr:MULTISPECIES: nuclease-related domain-containing protein [Bacillaceae]MBU9723385.1 NERD domain-containing protein [Bacillus alkalicola]
MKFTKELEQRLYAINSGYEGEVKFDTFYENCPDNWVILNDIWLKIDNFTFQIDSLLITTGTNYLFDVKNFLNEYEYRNGRFYRKDQETRSNPLKQLERCDTSYRYLLKQLGLNFPVVSNLAFVNEKFTLFGATRDLPIILPTQMEQFFQQLKTTEAKTSKRSEQPSQHQMHLANQILSLHVNQSPYKDLPDYSFEILEKGLVCGKCGTFFAPPGKLQRTLLCHKCGCEESVENAILRCIEEYRLLFPNDRITTKRIQEWCRVITCERRIRRSLNKYFQRIGHSTSSYFVERSAQSI